MHTSAESEQGAVLLMVAAAMVLFLTIAALVLDLGSMRADRALSRTVTDQAAAAGSLDLTGGNGQTACETAVAYIDLNMPGGPFVGANCSTLPSACDATTAPVSTTATSGPWTATITYPVPNGHSLLDPSAVGATTQAISAEDGDQCERFGVQIDGIRDYFFANIMGASTGDTEVHSVARAQLGDSDDLVINLLVLERYDCDAISAAGSGSGDGGILTKAVWNPYDKAWEPGWIAADSIGSGSGCSADGVVDVDGNNAFIRSDGPPGCAGELNPGTGEGCGEIQVFAPGTPGCNHPACTSTGTVAPAPTRLGRRVTRAPVDHRYNCKSSYSFGAGWEISSCKDTATTPAHVDRLVADYGPAGGTPPSGFVTWTSLVPWKGNKCNVKSGTVFTVPAGVDVYVDCSPKLTVNGEVYFPDSDVVFKRDVEIQSGATLSFSSPAPSTEHVVYLRDGELSKAGSANLYIHNSTVYMSASSELDLGGGTGSLIWTAPNRSGYKFDDLALWSDGTSKHKFAGQAVLDLSGVFFAPVATISYQGQGTQHQVAAQFISRKLESGGKGLLVVAPRFDHAVKFPDVVEIQLIR